MQKAVVFIALLFAFFGVSIASDEAVQPHHKSAAGVGYYHMKVEDRENLEEIATLYLKSFEEEHQKLSKMEPDDEEYAETVCTYALGARTWQYWGRAVQPELWQKRSTLILNQAKENLIRNWEKLGEDSKESDKEESDKSDSLEEKGFEECLKFYKKIRNFTAKNLNLAAPDEKEFTVEGLLKVGNQIHAELEEECEIFVKKESPGQVGLVAQQGPPKQVGLLRGLAGKVCALVWRK